MRRGSPILIELESYMRIKLGEFFCGPGGIAVGAELANPALEEFGVHLEHSWAVDNHNDTVETYRRNINGASRESAICADVRDMIPYRIGELSDIDGFAYGFPCNDFSVVGEHKGFGGEFGPLYSYGIPVLDALKPKFFIAENVGGIRSANEGKAFKQIIHDLEAAGPGYKLTPHLYRFEEYGIPQARHRVIIVGIRKDQGKTFKPPAPTHLESPITCLQALSIPPILSDAHNHELTKQHPRVVARLQHIRPGENAWTANLPEELKLNVSGAQLSQIYKRLDPDKPSYTITGSGGGGTHVYHWSEPRALTNRERARLQTFPDGFVFHGSKESIRRQIGMAVPPYGAKMIFEAIVKTLLDVKYDSVEQNL